MENNIYEPHKSSIGNLDANVVALIAYLGSTILGLIPGVKYVAFLVPIIIFFIEKDSKFVKFHAMQAILLSVAAFILTIVIGIIAGILLVAGSFVGYSIFLALVWIVAIAILVISIIAAVKSYKYEIYKLPLIGKWAEKIALK